MIKTTRSGGNSDSRGPFAWLLILAVVPFGKTCRIVLTQNTSRFKKLPTTSALGNLLERHQA